MAATKSEQFEHNENPADAGFLLSGDTAGVFAKVLCTSTPVTSSVCENGNQRTSLRRGFSLCGHGIFKNIDNNEYRRYIVPGIHEISNDPFARHCAGIFLQNVLVSAHKAKIITQVN
ncbi:TPA: hypothetical protein ACOVFI_001551 [Citrobacter braakii]